MKDDTGDSVTHRSIEPDELSKSFDNLFDQQTWEEDSVEISNEPEQHSDPLPPATPPPLLRIVEALLFVGGPPLTPAKAGEIVRGLTPSQFEQTIHSLVRDYRRQGRPYTIESQGAGYVFVLRQRFHYIRDKLYGGAREARLSPPAIDVLALVAYRQPATKREVDTMRGADSGALLRQLVRRGLIAITLRAEANSREVSYGTTARFLELFGLKSLEDLPQTQDLQKL